MSRTSRKEILPPGFKRDVAIQFIAHENSFFAFATQFLRENHIKSMLLSGDDSEQILSQIARTNADVTFISMRGNANSLEFSRKVKRVMPQTHCVVYVDPEDFKLEYLVNFNISAYLSSVDLSLTEIVLCVETLTDGYRYIGSQIRESLAKVNEFEFDLTYQGFNLTKQEIVILNLLAKGLRSKDISDRLFISQNTLNNHKTNIKSKLNLMSNREIVFFAMRNGRQPKNIQIENPDV